MRRGRLSTIFDGLLTEGIRLIDTRHEQGALGGCGERIDRLDEVGPALERAFASGLPACINVPTDPSAVFGGMTAM